jgi:hypothetical protein
MMIPAPGLGSFLRARPAPRSSQASRPRTLSASSVAPISRVVLMDVYEIQVLDGHETPTYADGTTAAIYGQYPPLVNACRRPGEW